MMNFLLTEHKFQEGIKKYYYDFQFKNSSLDQMWKIFDEVRYKKVVWRENVTLETVMESWTKKNGYPIITVTRNYESRSAKLTQVKEIID